MAKAYKCDLCGEFTEYAQTVGGLDFKIGERRDEFTGRYNKMKEVREICPNCYDKLISKVKEIYEKSKE